MTEDWLVCLFAVRLKSPQAGDYARSLRTPRHVQASLRSPWRAAEEDFEYTVIKFHSIHSLIIIRLYGLRFKIEHSFKQAVHVIGSFSYHFWMKDMKPLQRRNGNQFLHRESEDYRHAIKRKIGAYHVFVHAGIVSQGLLHYLASCFPKQVWLSFGSWLRTIHPGIAPSERVVSMALRHSFPEFLLANSHSHNFAKFIVQRQDFDRLDVFRIASG